MPIRPPHSGDELSARDSSVHQGDAGLRVFPRRLNSANAVPLWLQVSGFLLIIALLVLDGYVGLHGAIAVRSEVAEIDSDQSQYGRLISRILEDQRALSVAQSGVMAEGDGPGSLKFRRELDQIQRSLTQIFSQISENTPNAPAWLQTESAARSLMAEMERIRDLPTLSAADLANIERKYSDFAVATADLVQSSRGSSDSARRQIETTVRRESIEDRFLLSGCLIVACVFLWTAARTHRLLKEQSEELSLVSWQLLEKQESLARRISRELHDELGQSLTALKTNFSRHAGAGCADTSWMADCTELLRDSIRNAHEISQLLRPTVLDDFGLDSALAWLCERFEQRNQIRVTYNADFHGRLEPQAETHVFRIAQEALTNVARHAHADAVRVVLQKHEDLVSLEVSDNGIGLRQGYPIARSSLGLTGMRARARTLGGEMEITTGPRQGTTLRVSFPFHEIMDEHDPGSAR